jgi:type II secretory pathway component PulC
MRKKIAGKPQRYYWMSVTALFVASLAVWIAVMIRWTVITSGNSSFDLFEGRYIRDHSEILKNDFNPSVAELRADREIFGLHALPEKSEANAFKAGTAGFRIAGIMTGKENMAIVETNDRKASVFLKRGDEIDGAVVKDVFSDRILLEYNGELIELEKERK